MHSACSLGTGSRGGGCAHEPGLRAWADPPAAAPAPKVWGPQRARGSSPQRHCPPARPTRAGPAVAVGRPAAGPAPVQLKLADLPVQLFQVGLQADVLAS